MVEIELTTILHSLIPKNTAFTTLILKGIILKLIASVICKEYYYILCFQYNIMLKLTVNSNIKTYLQSNLNLLRKYIDTKIYQDCALVHGQCQELQTHLHTSE